MLKPVWGQRRNDRPQRRKKPLRTIAMLPTLLTLGNLYFGFAASYYCLRELEELGAGRMAGAAQTLKSAFLEARAPSFLAIAAWMILLGMVCDALDGRVARKTGQSSRFGEQLDSLADMVTFGIAPALMMVAMCHRELTLWGHPPFGFARFGQVAVFIGAFYACCAGLRLARFNVEASAEEAAHEGFQGLPSPAAAGAVGSLIYVHDSLATIGAVPVLVATIAKLMPLATLMIALLMVSRVPYRHAVSSFFRRRPFGHIVLVLLVIPLLLLYTSQVLAVAAWLFVGGGLIRYAVLRIQGKPTLPAPPPDEAENDNGDDGTRDSFQPEVRTQKL